MSVPPAPRPPRLDTRLFRHELTPLWLDTAATMAGEAVGSTAGIGRVAWLGCGAWVTPAAVAALHPWASVQAWDPNPALMATLSEVGRDADLANLEVHGLTLPPDASSLGRCELVVVDGLVDSMADGDRQRLLDAAAALVQPGGLLAVGYRTVVGWGEVAPLVRLLQQTLADGLARSARDAVAPLRLLRSRGAAYPAVRPVVGAWLDDLLDRPPDEVVGTWAADDLRPVSHAQICEALTGHGLDFVTSAHLHDPLSTAPDRLADQVRGAPTSVLRESLADLAVRRTRRIDLFRSGLSPVTEQARSRAVQRMAVLPVGMEVADTLGAAWADPREALTTALTGNRAGGSSGSKRSGRPQRKVGSGRTGQAGNDDPGAGDHGGPGIWTGPKEPTRISHLWPGEPPRRREQLTRALLGAGLAHPMVSPVEDAAGDEIAPAAHRLTQVLTHRSRPEVQRYRVAPAIGSAVTDSSAAEIGEDGRRALGVDG